MMHYAVKIIIRGGISMLHRVPRTLLLLAVLGVLAVGALADDGPGAQANPDAIITVNSNADTNTRDSVMTLREAIMVATGELPLADLALGECNQVSGAEYSPFPFDYCLSLFFPPGAAYSDTIVFDTVLFDPPEMTLINLTSALPSLDTVTTPSMAPRPGRSCGGLPLLSTALPSTPATTS